MPDLDWIPLRALADVRSADEQVLALALEHERALLSHDVRTLYPLAIRLAANDVAIPRTIVAPRSLGRRASIDQVEILLLAGTDADWGVGVVRLPLPLPGG